MEILLVGGLHRPTNRGLRVAGASPVCFTPESDAPLGADQRPVGENQPERNARRGHLGTAPYLAIQFVFVPMLDVLLARLRLVLANTSSGTLPVFLRTGCGVGCCLLAQTEFGA